MVRAFAIGGTNEANCVILWAKKPLFRSPPEVHSRQYTYLQRILEVGISFVHYQEKLCAAPGPGVASVNLALHLVCSFTSSSVSEWSVCEVCLS